MVPRPRFHLGSLAHLVLGFLGAVFLPNALAGQTPETVSSVEWRTRVAGEVAAVVDSGDTVAMRRFVDERISPAARGERTREADIHLLSKLYKQSGGLTQRETEPTRTGVMATLWSRSRDMGTLLFVQPDPADSTKVLGLEILRAFHPEAEPRPIEIVDADDVARAVGAEAERLASTDVLSGVVLVGLGDSVVTERAFGLANVVTGEPIGPETRFQLASTGKMFTSVLIATFVEEGRLAFDDSLGALLPDQPWTPDARAITVRQLLSHTSGIGELWDAPGWDAAREYATSTELVPLFAGRDLLFPPGSQLGYSNAGYEVLGAIAESLCGKPYAECVAERVFAPAGMTGTGFGSLRRPDVPLAVPYAHAGDDYFEVDSLVSFVENLPAKGSAAGGGLGTARDLFRFARALHAGRIVSFAMVDTLTQALNVIPSPLAESYGYGFESFEVQGLKVWGHGGGGGRAGICTKMSSFADGSWTVVVLTNHDPPTCELLNRAIVEAVGAVGGRDL